MLLDAEYAREILEAIRTEPKPARDLAAACDASRATVYRRLNELEAADLVASWTAHDPDGHHRTAFEATFESVTVDLGADGLSVSVATEPPGRTTGPPGAAAPVDRSTAPPGELLALLTDEHAREILEAIRDAAEPARVLAERCDASRATVYRRLARLREAGLVEAEMTYDDDGHHRETFRAAVERVRVDLGPDGFEAELDAIDRPRTTRRYHHSP